MHGAPKAGIETTCSTALASRWCMTTNRQLHTHQAPYTLWKAALDALCSLLTQAAHLSAGPVGMVRHFRRCTSFTWAWLHQTVGRWRCRSGSKQVPVAACSLARDAHTLLAARPRETDVHGSTAARVARVATWHSMLVLGIQWQSPCSARSKSLCTCL